jgi:hypothetical protein
MELFRKAMSGLTIGLVLALAACGDNPVGVNSGDELSDAEIQAVFNAFGGAFSNVDASAHVVAPAEGIQMADIQVDQSVDVSTQCALGGGIALSGSVKGTVNDETYASNLVMEVGVGFDACGVPSDEVTLTVDGDVDFYAAVVIGEGSFSTEGWQRGGFDFTTDDGRSGSCAINIDFDASYTEGESAQSNVSGEVCGRSASQFDAYTGS